jgi:hypothetical protein
MYRLDESVLDGARRRDRAGELMSGLSHSRLVHIDNVFGNFYQNADLPVVLGRARRISDPKMAGESIGDPLPGAWSQPKNCLMMIFSKVSSGSSFCSMGSIFTSLPTM